LYCAGGGISFATERPVAGEARTALTCAVRCSVGSVLIQVAAASFFMTLYVVCLYKKKPPFLLVVGTGGFGIGMCTSFSFWLWAPMQYNI
jgi:hypothetical protein